MRIAFDVMGTIEGSKGAVILEAFRKLQELGHTCVVWSNSHSYAAEAVKKHGLKAEYGYKYSNYDLRDRGTEPYDVAIEDDRSQTWLGANRLIFVDEITDANELVARILKGV